MKKLLLSVLTISGLIFTGCSDDDSTPATTGPSTSNLSGNLVNNLTLANDGTEYILNGALFVKDGATLTIEAGVTVKALAGGTDVYILVEKGGKIIADGTASSPIKFTSNASNPLQVIGEV